jgi:hypothetical protein
MYVKNLSTIPLFLLSMCRYKKIWRFVLPLTLVPPHTMTYPPIYLSCSEMQAGAKRSFGLLHTLARLSPKSRQDLDSSVNKTGVQLRGLHCIWSRAQSRRSLTWLFIKQTRMAGTLAFIPASCKLFLIIWVDTHTFVAFCKLFRNEVAFRKRLRRAWTTIYRSSACVVHVERPPPYTFPLIWKRFHIRWTTLLETFKVRETCLWDMPVCNMPTPLFISSSVSHLLTFRFIILNCYTNAAL